MKILWWSSLHFETDNILMHVHWYFSRMAINFGIQLFIFIQTNGNVQKIDRICAIISDVKLKSELFMNLFIKTFNSLSVPEKILKM